MKQKFLMVLFLFALCLIYPCTNAKADLVIVHAPMNVKATATFNSIKLTWDAADDVSSYAVGYSTVEADVWWNAQEDKNWTTIDVPAGTTSYTITGLKSNTKYYFSVASVRTQSPPFDTMYSWALNDEITTSKALGAPTNVSVSAFGNTASLSWGKLTGANGYKVAYSTDNKKWTCKNVGNVSSYEFTGLKYNTKYYFKVVALKNSENAGKWSDAVSVTTKYLGTPKNLTVSASGNTASLSWSKLSGADGYKVAYSTDNKKWTCKSIGNVSSYKFTGLKYNTKYYFKVVALLNSENAGIWSSAVTASTASYAAPSNIKVTTKTHNALALSWSKVSGAEGYKIGYSTDNKNWSYKNVGNVASYNLTGLSAQTKYYYRIVSMKAGAPAGNWSKTLNATTSSPLAAPANFKAVKDIKSIALSWGKVSGANGYKICYSKDNKNWTYVTIGNVASYNITGLQANTKYYCRVITLKDGLAAGKWSTKLAVTTKKLLTAPQNISATATINSLTVSWSKVSGADGYKIEYSTDNKNWTAKNVKDVASTKITGLSTYQKYYIRMVCLKNGVVCGSYSTTYSFTTSALSKAVVTAKVTTGSITASWQSITNADEYMFYYSLDGGSSWLKVNVGTKTSYTITGLKSSTKYYLRVVPLKNSKAAAGYTTYSVTTAEIKPPSGITATPKSTSINITWNKSSDGNGYRIAYSKNKVDSNRTIVDVGDVDNVTIKDLTPNTTYYFCIAVLKDGKVVSSTSGLMQVTTKPRDLQYLPCPLCAGSGRCRTCNGSGNCLGCGGTGMSGGKVCGVCVGHQSCSVCGGYRTCRGCNGERKVLVDINS